MNILYDCLFFFLNRIKFMIYESFILNFNIYFNLNEYRMFKFKLMVLGLEFKMYFIGRLKK